ncbi:MAG: hypothetical protein Q9160_002967 [Pyrenula sp. 1 TL-2023]
MAEVATGRADTELLDHLDKVTEECLRTALQFTNGQLMVEEWQAQAFQSGRHHWYILYPHFRNPKLLEWGSNFLSYAIEANLCRYLEAKMSAADYQRKPGRPLLDYAVSPSRWESWEQFNVGTLYSETFKTLLEHGESPNEMYLEQTVWEHMWTRLLGRQYGYHARAFSNTFTMLDIMRLMIEACANPNARILYTRISVDIRRRKEQKTDWQRHSCLFAVLAKLKAPSYPRLELAKELVQRGAHFYTGEKESIAQSERLQ